MFWPSDTMWICVLHFGQRIYLFASFWLDNMQEIQQNMPVNKLCNLFFMFNLLKFTTGKHCFKFIKLPLSYPEFSMEKYLKIHTTSSKFYNGEIFVNSHYVTQVFQWRNIWTFTLCHPHFPMTSRNDDANLPHCSWNYMHTSG